MKNATYFITKETTKYWKKAVKKDRVQVARKDRSIYIVNGYNAFKIPASESLWNEICRPAFMVDMPENETAFQWVNGEKGPADAAAVLNIWNTNEKAITTAATRSQYVFDGANIPLRLFVTDNGAVAAVKVEYDKMVDFTAAKEIRCNGKRSAVYVSDGGDFAALLLPMNYPDGVLSAIEKAFALCRGENV